MQIEQAINSGKPHILNPRKALNKAFLKVKPNHSQIEQFQKNLIQLLDRTNDTESEEFHKNLVIDFLEKPYYEPHHFINIKGRNDLVVHNGKIGQIDQLVYRPYGLTEEEIAKIECS